MAKGEWWFKFEWRDWMNDPNLKLCSYEAKGFWIDCLCVMREMESAEISGTIDEVRRLLGCLPEDVIQLANELKNTKTADVTFCNGNVTILSRRAAKELSAKQNNRLRVRKHRSNADVMLEKRDRVRVRVRVREEEEKKVEKKEEVLEPKSRPNTPHDPFAIDPNTFEYPIKELLEAFPDMELRPNAIGFIQAAVKPEDKIPWQRTIQIYQMNFDPLKKRYLPDKTANLLGVFENEKSKYLGEKNGTNKPNTKKSNADILRESAESIERRFANSTGNIPNAANATDTVH